jgi:hypothetical protein
VPLSDAITVKPGAGLKVEVVRRRSPFGISEQLISLRWHISTASCRSGRIYVSVLGRRALSRQVALAAALVLCVH